MKTRIQFRKLTAWLLTLAMLMTFIPGFSLLVNAAEITPTEPTLTTDRYDINGDDTMDSVYEITTAAELYWFAGLVNGTLSGVTKNNSANAILKNNITVNENVIVDGKLTTDTSNMVVWTAIGKSFGSTSQFKGQFDGNGKTISGLYVNDTATYRGFVGYLGGSVKNLTIADSYFYSTTTSLGAIVGSAASGSSIENCKLTGSIVSGKGSIGGIVGYVAAGVTLSNCHVSESEVSGTADKIGGIVGSAGGNNSSNTSYIRLCTITDSNVNGNYDVGGILGRGGSLSYTYLIGCCNYGTDVTATTKDAGGIVGYYGKIYSSFSSAKVSAPTKQGPFYGTSGNAYSSVFDSTVYGETINYASSKCYTTEEIKSGVATYYLANSTSGTGNSYSQWGQKLGVDPYPVYNPDNEDELVVVREENADADGGYIYKNLSAGAPEVYEPNADGYYEIANREDWYKFARRADEDHSVKAVLTDDIDFSDITTENYNDYRIGADYQYIGIFDGNGYTVSGLPQIELPLFDTIGSGGELKNLTLSGATVNNISSTPAVGLVESNNGTVSGCAVSDITIIGSTSSAMIGTNRGTVTNCTATNITVTGKSASAGIVYLNTGTIEKCNVVSGTVKAVHTENYDSHAGGICVRSGAGTIRECSNNADVTAESSSTMIYAAAGIVAAPSDSNGASVQVTKCFNSGDIKGGYAGGISGYDNTSVYVNLSLCYNEGAITGNITGGIAAYGSNDSSDKIINCYNVGAVNATSKAGGIAGEQGNCIIENCHNYAKIVSDNIGAPIVGYSSGVWPGPDELINNHAIEGNVDAPTVSSYLDTKGVTSNFDAVTKGSTREEFADGTVTAKLNAGNSETVWYQYNDYPILEQRHMHKWEYTLDGTTIKAECVNAGCDLTNNSGGSVTIKAPTELVYSGSAMDAECTYDNWVPNKPTIVYNEVDRVNVTGNDITASITLGDATATVNYKIQPREIIASMITLSETYLNYNGAVQSVTVAVQYNSNTTLNAGTDYEITGITSATDISTGDGYDVTVTGKGNYIGTVTKYWKINKGSLSTQIEIEGWEYLDTPNAPSVTNNPENGEVTYTYYVSAGRGYNPTGSDHGAQTEGGVPSYAGTYYVGAVIAETEHYLETMINSRKYKMFTISPREVTNPTFEGLQSTYPYDNGNEIKPTFTLKDDLGNEIPASEYTVSYSNNTNAGEATITISDAEGGNYTIRATAKFSIIEHSHDWNISANGNVITATCQSIFGNCPNPTSTVTIVPPAPLIYDGNDKVVTTIGTIDGITIPEVQYTGDRKNVGTFTASLTVDNATATLSVTIEKATINNASFDVATPEALAEKQTTVENGTGYVAAISWNTTEPKFAFNTAYMATVKLTADGNHEFADSLSKDGWTVALNNDKSVATFTKTFEATRKQKIESVTVPTNVNLDTHKPDAAAVIATLPTTVSVALEENGTDNLAITWNCNNFNTAPLYPNTFIWTATNDKYDSNNVVLGGAIIVSNPVANAVTITVKPKNTSLVYNAAIVDLTSLFDIDENAGNATYTVTNKTGAGTQNETALTITKAGTFTVKVDTAPNGIYASGTQTATLTVEKANGTGTVLMEGWTYGEVSKEPVISNNKGEATYQYKIKGADDSTYSPNKPSDAGEYTVKATFAETDLYKETTATADFTIAKKDITGATVGNFAELIYTGGAQTPSATVIIDNLTVTGVWSDVTNVAEKTTFTADGNFTGTIAGKETGMAKADPTYTEPTVKTGLVYNGSAQALVNEGAAEGGIMKYYIGGAQATENVVTGTSAGEYTVTCIIAGDENHNNIVVGKYTVTIAKKTIDNVIVLTAPIKNTMPQTEITGNGYTATVVWSPTVTSKFGYNTEYTATITIAVDGNHTVTGIAANGYTVEGAKTVTNDANSNIVTVIYAKTGSRPSSGGGGVSSYTVKFEANGGTAVANKSVTRNSKVTEPTTPTKDGFTFDGWYTDKEFTTAYDFDTKVTKSFTLYAKWNEIPAEDDDQPGISGHNCPSLEFSDLDITQWYHLDADYVIENDIFRGTTPNTFTPNGNITRAMMITVLYRTEGEPEVTGETTFLDIDEDAYYAKAVVWGQQNGIIKGYSDTEYAPERDILREQIAAIMHRYAEYKGIDVSVGENTNILSYDDFESISEYAIASMQWAVGSGMIKGRTERTLNPEAFATRVEIAAMLHRFIEANK